MSTNKLEVPFIYNSVEALQAQEKYEQEVELQYHLHQLEWDGASSLHRCNWIRSLREIKFPLPDLSDFQKDHETQEVGRTLHKDIQGKLVNYYSAHPIIHTLGAEIYCKMGLIPPTEELPGLSVETKMDLVYVQPNNEGECFTDTVVQYRNVAETVLTFAPDVIVAQIEDIKSMSDWGFTELRNGIVSRSYIDQFLFEMKYAGLKTLMLVAIHKDTGKKLYVPVHWDEALWEECLEYNRRRIRLTAELLPLMEESQLLVEQYSPQKEDLACVYKWEIDNIDWWSCPLAKCQVFEKKYPKKTSQRILEPCPQAIYRINELFDKQFPVGSQWKRVPVENDGPGSRPSKVTVTSVDIEKHQVYSQTAGTKTVKPKMFSDTAVYTWFNYKPLDEEEEE